MATRCGFLRGLCEAMTGPVWGPAPGLAGAAGLAGARGGCLVRFGHSAPRVLPHAHALLHVLKVVALQQPNLLLRARVLSGRRGGGCHEARHRHSQNRAAATGSPPPAAALPAAHPFTPSARSVDGTHAHPECQVLRTQLLVPLLQAVGAPPRRVQVLLRLRAVGGRG